MILEGKGKIYMGLKRIEFGAYEMIYVRAKNNMKIRSVPEIVLKASNENGGLYFMYLYTGKRMHNYT